jgi:hypothetical protein
LTVFARVCFATAFTLCVLSESAAAFGADPLPPCKTPTVSKQAPAVIPASVLSAPLPASVERCWLKPGLVATYRNSVRGEYTQTFLGYPEESQVPCNKGVFPCYEWINNDAVRTFFMDGELSRIGLSSVDGKPYFFLERFFRWPLTIPDSWEIDYAITPRALIHRSVKVVGWENVSIAAGQFRTIRIDVHDVGPDFGRRSLNEHATYYYDPALGLTVKYASSYSARTYELVSISWVKPE